MAKTYKGIVLEIGGDASGLSKELKAAEKETKSLQTQLNAVNKALKLDPGNVELVAQKQRILTEQVTSTESKLKILKQTQDEFNKKAKEVDNINYTQLESSIEKTEKTLTELKKQQDEFVKSGKNLDSQEYKDLEKQIDDTEKELKELKQTQNDFNEYQINSAGYVSLQTEIVKTEEKLKSLKSTQSGLSAETEAFANKLDSVGDGLINAGKKTAKYSATAATALTGMAYASITFDEAWTGVKKVYQGSDDDLESIEKSIISLSNATGKAATEIAGVAETGATLGQTGDDLIKFTEVMVKLGDTTTVSAEDAADSLGKLMNITKTSADEYENLGSAIVALGNEMATSEDSIISISQRFASSGTQAKMSEADILALAAAMASLGIDGEAAGSSLSRTINKINSAVSSGSAELTTFADVAGMSAAEFQKAWNEDSASAFEQVVIGLGKASEQGKDLTSILTEMGISSTNDVNAMLALATSSDELTKALRISNEGWEENTALAEESGTYYDSAGSKIDQLKQSVTNLGIQLGDIMLPIITNIVDGLKNLVNWFSNLNPVVQKIIVIVLALVAAISPILLVLGTLAKSVSNMITLGGQISKLFGQGGIVAKALSFIKTTLSGLFSLIAAHPVIAVVTAIVAIIVVLYNKCEWFRDAVNNVINAVVEFFKWLGENIVNIVQSIVEFITVTVPQTINDVVTWFSELPGKIWEFLVDIVNKVAQWGSDMWNKFKEWVVKTTVDVATWFSELPGKIWNAIVTFVTVTIPKWGRDIWNALKGWASTIVNDFVSWIGEIPGKMLSIGSDIVSGIWNGISGAAGWLSNKVSDFCSGVVDGFKSFFGIKSPSRLMRDEVGGYLAEGVGVGFIDEMSSVNKQITNSLDGTMDTIQSVLNNESSKQLAFETMATQDLSTTMSSFESSILGAVQSMLNSVNIENNFIMGSKLISREITPLVNQNLGSIAERDSRQ